MIQLEDRLYTSTEVAEILGVSLRSVYRYLEENKLNAEIKTATGRHRFSKKNIIEFLYPNGDTPQPTVPVKTSINETSVKNKPEDKRDEQEVRDEPEAQEEPIDWLAKFREAAKKFKEDADSEEKAKQTKGSAEPEVQAQANEEPRVIDDRFSGFYGMNEVREEVVEERPSNKILFYRSSLGGLKDIAQNIDKSARNSGVDYAFTLNAGLSLFKPIKPFSVLHAYVRTGDLTFFEKVLSLTPADESTAQLCLVVSSDDRIFTEKAELHGLYVVSKSRLIDDIKEMGEGSLTEEAKGVL